MPATEMTTKDVPEVYRRFARAIGDANWQGAVERQEYAIRLNPFLREHLPVGPAEEGLRSSSCESSAT